MKKKNSLYSCLEILKNGYIERDKYNSACVKFITANKLITIVLANFLPSLDRWDIREFKHYNKTTNNELIEDEIYDTPLSKITK